MKDINGQPTSKFDGTHVSTDIRDQLAKLGPEKAARIRKVADEPPAVTRERP